jgi:sugar phosphate isomerase/epimerase
MKFGICNEIFQGWEIERTMDYAKGVGYDGLEIAPFTLASNVAKISNADRRRIRESAARSGMEIIGLHWLLAKTGGLHLTHPDAGIRQNTSNYLCELVDCCADLGGTRLVFGSPQQRHVVEGIPPAQAWQWATETFQAAVRRAEERAVVFCFEPLSPSETNFINHAHEAIRFARQFNSPAMKIILDVKAMCSEQQSVPEIIRDSWPEFAHFHANDRNRKGPGFGEVNFRPIAAALKETGYAGYVSVEVFEFEEGPEVIATKSLRCLREAFA